jgi:mannitol-specific phosphotransferase system IIBC component
MRLHLKRLAAGAFILAILLGSLWISINNEQLLNTILYVVSFCIISYLIGYFILKIRIKWWKGKLNLLKKMNFTRAMKDKKDESNNSSRANYRKNRKSQRNRKDNIKI